METTTWIKKLLTPQDLWRDWGLNKMADIPSLQWRHNVRDGVSNNQPHHCLLKRLFRRRWKKTSKLRVTGLCEGNSPATGEFPARRASNAENVSIWWRHHVSAHYHVACRCLLVTGPLLTKPPFSGWRGCLRGHKTVISGLNTVAVTRICYW